MNYYDPEEVAADALIEKYGYSKKAVDEKKKVVVVEGFEPREVKLPTPFLAKEIKQLEKEIKELEQAKHNVTRDYGKYVRDKVREYNYIVTYKHLKEKNSEETREVMKLRPKSRQQLIFQKINKLKDQLLDDAQKTLPQKYSLNKTLVDLYKDYKRSIGQTHNTSVDNDSAHMRKGSNSFNLNSSIIERKTSVSNPASSRPLNSNRVQLTYRRDRPKQQSLLEPFPQKSNYEESKKIETKIKQDKQVLNLWRLKIDEYKDNYIKAQEAMKLNETILVGESRKRLEKEEMNTADNYRPDSKYAIFEINDNQQVDVEGISNKNKERKEILRTIIKKKNTRYIKHKGTKILVAFDPDKVASEMLEGSFVNHSSSPEKVHQKSQLQYQDSEVYDLQVLAGPPRRLPNDTDYELEYKNEKINLSLKAQKK